MILKSENIGIESMVKLILKSGLAGVVGAGLFFSFLMPVTIAVLAVKVRLTTAGVNHTNVALSPGPFFQHVGLPMSAVVFVICFVLGLRRFRRVTP